MGRDLDELQEALEEIMSEIEMALFTGVVMAMFSAIAVGAKPDALIQFLETHRQNYMARNQANAALIMEGFIGTVRSTIR